MAPDGAPPARAAQVPRSLLDRLLPVHFVAIPLGLVVLAFFISRGARRRRLAAVLDAGALVKETGDGRGREIPMWQIPGRTGCLLPANQGLQLAPQVAAGITPMAALEAVQEGVRIMAYRQENAMGHPIEISSQADGEQFRRTFAALLRDGDRIRIGTDIWRYRAG
jgi:hypothetical protein